jgi:nitrite reductase (NADH) small subunit
MSKSWGSAVAERIHGLQRRESTDRSDPEIHGMSKDFLDFPQDDEPETKERPRAFVAAGAVADVPPGSAKSIWLKNQKVAVFNVKGTLLACKDRCTHMGALLSEGRVNGRSVVCSWHGWSFDLESGHCTNKDWAAVEAYRVRVVGDRYEVEVPVD